jgi:hypothetical protein
MAPFVIFCLPRSRSRWLSYFLTHGAWQCGHDEIRHCRSLDDVKSWLAQPCTGTVETAGAPFWRLLLHYRPDVRVVTIRRPVDDVVRSLTAIGGVFDPRMIQRFDHKLDQIERRVPGVRTFAYADLSMEATCATLFEHCLGQPCDPVWWQKFDPLNVQVNLEHIARYCVAHRAQLDKLTRQAKHRMLTTLWRSPEIDGVTFQTETMASYDEAMLLIQEHLVLTDRSPDAGSEINVPLLRKMDDARALQIVTARSNGRLFGYLMSVVGPALDAENKLTASHTAFFASPLIKNLGFKLQQVAARTLKERGVRDIQLRASVSGEGPRLGTFYRRMGAEDFGQLYRLSLED